MAKVEGATMRLVGEDGNAYSIMGRAQKALRAAGATKEQQDEYLNEAKSGDYDNLLRVTMEWVNCDTDESEDECEVCGYEVDDCACEWCEVCGNDHPDPCVEDE